MLDTTIRAGRAPLFALATAASVVALTATAPQADAAFVIDDFSSPSPAAVLIGTSGSATNADVVTSLGIGERTVSRTTTAPGGGPAASNNTSVGDGSLTFDSGSTESQTTTISYSFTSALDLLSHGDRFAFDFSSNDSFPGKPNANFPIPVELTDGVGMSETASFQLLDEGSVGATVENLLFSAYSSVDLSNVTGLEFVLDTNGFAGAPDFSIDSIAAVPLPGALPLFLGGLAGVGYVVRRRQRQAAAA